jgi:hypothetical protein
MPTMTQAQNQIDLPVLTVNDEFATNIFFYFYCLSIIVSTKAAIISE